MVRDFREVPGAENMVVGFIPNVQPARFATFIRDVESVRVIGMSILHGMS